MTAHRNVRVAIVRRMHRHPERSARGPGEAARRVRVAARGRGREGCPARRLIMDGHNRIGALMAKRQSAPTSAEWFTLPLWRAVPFGPRPETIGASPWRSPAAVQAGWAVTLRGGRSRWALVVASLQVWDFRDRSEYHRHRLGEVRRRATPRAGRSESAPGHVRASRCDAWIRGRVHHIEQRGDRRLGRDRGASWPPWVARRTAWDWPTCNLCPSINTFGVFGGLLVGHDGHKSV